MINSDWNRQIKMGRLKHQDGVLGVRQDLTPLLE